MILTTNRETYLSNHLSKDQLIKLLCQKSLQSGINALQSKSDTDVIIFKKAIEEVTEKDVDIDVDVTYLSLESV